MSPTRPPEPVQLLDAALAAASVADAVHEGRDSRSGLRSKADGSLVSAADLAVEDAVRDCLAHLTPGEPVVGEERSSPEEVEGLLAGEVDGWIVDPIDQTRHFVRDDPEFGLLLAYVRAGTPVVGCISAPLLGLRSWAAEGCGAFVGGERVRVSQVATLRDAEVAFAGFAEWSPTVAHRNLTAVVTACAYPHGSRGGFLQHVRVAQGATEASLEPWGAPWDHLAGAVIVTEAGGRATALDGGPVSGLPGAGLALSNGLVHEELLARLSRVVDDGPQTLE